MRTRFYDDHLLASAREGIRQAVILGSGLDTRAYRLDWPAALRGAGFDSAARTVWVAEGLLAYLPAEAEQRLLERVHSASASGSCLALDRIAGSLHGDSGERLRRLSARSGIKMDKLMSADVRGDIGGWLAGRSWAVQEQAAGTIAARCGRDLGDPFRDDAGPATSTDTEPPWLDTVFLTTDPP